MRTTLNIDDDLLEQARTLSGLNEKTALVRESLKASDRARECAASGQAGRLAARFEAGSRRGTKSDR